MKEKIEQLEKQIKHHNRKYFLDNAPEISDEEFDELTEELRKLKPDSPVLFELVGDHGDIQHPTPMLSLEKKYTYNEIKKWVENINDNKFIIEPKYDGMAARYQNGTLATRGNGIYGEDISERLKNLNIIGKLPKNNDSTFGEIIIPLSYFNQKLAKTYKNPRNAAVGIVKAKNLNEEGINALLDGGVHLVLHDQAKKLTVKKSDLLNEERWEEILEEVFHSDYPLDGIVIKATNPTVIENAGTTQHHEKWQVAYKSPAERKISTVKDIKNQVGRTGRITSVAVIEPINLSGATVTNVTLHNYQYIKDSGIDIGSKVEVCRSGEVIPFITKVFPSGQQSQSKDSGRLPQDKPADSPQKSRKHYEIPTKCPICNQKLVENNKYLECVNKKCPARESQSIEYFFKTLGAEELGLKTIIKFINEFKLTNIIDFYKLDEEKIAKLEGFGEKSAKKILKNIDTTLNKTITPNQLLQALGIKDIGPAASRWIINEFGFDNLPDLTIEKLKEVKGIGEKKAEYFINDIKDKWWIVKDLKKLGLKFKASKAGDKFSGLSFAITGKKGSYSRDELIQKITENGGEYKSAITKDLTYLIAGEDAGSKLQKAQDLGVTILTEAEFISMTSN